MIRSQTETYCPDWLHLKERSCFCMLNSLYKGQAPLNAAVSERRQWMNLTDLSTGVMLIRIVFAGICGIIVGYGRQRSNKPSGIKTHMVVAFASALFILISKYGFADSQNFDPTRIASQIVSGISFLGDRHYYQTACQYRRSDRCRNHLVLSCDRDGCRSGIILAGYPGFHPAGDWNERSASAGEKPQRQTGFLYDHVWFDRCSQSADPGKSVIYELAQSWKTWKKGISHPSADGFWKQRRQRKVGDRNFQQSLCFFFPLSLSYWLILLLFSVSYPHRWSCHLCSIQLWKRKHQPDCDTRTIKMGCFLRSIW